MELKPCPFCKFAEVFYCEYDTYSDSPCPICKEDGWMLWDDAIHNDMDEYCGKCGQAIDWEVSE